MELGLDGNIFSRPFTKYQRLATHWWFHVLWQYCSCYSVTLHFHITATRVGNVLHIELFIREGYTGDMLESTNRVRKFYQVTLALMYCVQMAAQWIHPVLSLASQAAAPVYSPGNS
jgi:hypothetical protein